MISEGSCDTWRLE